MKKTNITKGMKFGRLETTGTIICKRNKSGRNIRYAECRCTCGNKRIVMISDLIRGHSKSCKCLNKEINYRRMIKHGLRYTNFYDVFIKMKERCSNPRVKDYKWYGLRGIKVKWKKFEDFRDDMYESYLIHRNLHGKIDTTIDRINNDGHYCKENCKWSTQREQANNRRPRRA